MALDTRNRRSAAVMVGQPWRPSLPLPAGGFSTVGDLLHLSYWSRVAGADTDTLTARSGAVLAHGSVRPSLIGDATISAAVVADAVTEK